MCAITGFSNYGGKISHKLLLKLVRALTVAAECRGTDATGISYIRDKNMVTFKKPKAAHKMRLYFPPDTKAAICHNRMTTQGSEFRNYNNHPFEGQADKPFALAHNGVLYNDADLRVTHQLPVSKIETDSYVAVQLIEQLGTLDFDSLRSMAENVLGSFTFSLLDTDNTLWLVKGSNPLYLIHFPELGLYAYNSTKEIMETTLKMTAMNRLLYEVIETKEGDILRIDEFGNLSRSTFVPQDYHVCRWSPHSIYGWDFGESVFDDEIPFDESYAALLELCGYFGVSEEEVRYLHETGYSYAEIEGFLMNPYELDQALMCGEV